MIRTSRINFNSTLLAIPLLIPHPTIVGPVIHIYFLALIAFSIFFHLSSSKIKKSVLKDLNEIGAPLLVTLFVILASHINGAIYNVPQDLNDFSDYAKFLFPFITFAIGLAFLYRRPLNNFAHIILLSAITYSILFLCFLYIGDDFFKKHELGKGSGHFRYGGIDYNPNTYSAIALILCAYTLVFLIHFKKVVWVLTFLILLTSLILAQSRTNTVLGGLFIVFLFLMSTATIRAKVIGAVFISFLACFILWYFQLPYLLDPGRFDLDETRGVIRRLSRGLEAIYQWEDLIHLVGIGPGRAAVERMDTFTYALYYVRFGLIGLIAFIAIHLYISYWATKNWVTSPRKGASHFSLLTKDFLLINIGLPLYILGANFAKERWIEPKLIYLWMLGLLVTVILHRRQQEKSPLLSPQELHPELND